MALLKPQFNLSSLKVEKLQMAYVIHLIVAKQFNEGVGSDTDYCYINGTNEVFRFILCNYTSINIVIVTHCWCLCFLIFVLSTNDFPC